MNSIKSFTREQEPLSVHPVNLLAAKNEPAEPPQEKRHVDDGGPDQEFLEGIDGHDGVPVLWILLRV